MENTPITDLSTWTYHDFLAYLLIYGASADLTLKPEEKQMIIDEVGKKQFEKVIHEFEKHSDYECLQVIMELGKKYCQSDSQKEILFADLKKIFFADGEFSLLEENCFRSIRKLIC